MQHHRYALSACIQAGLDLHGTCVAIMAHCLFKGLDPGAATHDALVPLGSPA